MQLSEMMQQIEINQKIITYNGIDIAVDQYLTAADRYSLIKIVMERSFDNGIYNLIKLDVYFHVALAIIYTDIEVTEEDMENQDAIYDWLTLSGLMNQILDAIPTEQYEALYQELMNSVETDMKYRHTFAGLASKIINDLPKNVEAARNIVDNFDPEQFKEVIEFAKAANGGRSIFDTLIPQK